MLRPCSVTLVDPHGVRHVAEVSAESVYEAAVLALRAFKASGFTDDVGPATRLEVEVRAATTRHVVSVGQIERWTDGVTVSPAERVRRQRLRALLDDSRPRRRAAQRS